MDVTDIQSICFLYVSCFSACFIFRQPSSGHHGTAYSQQGAMPEDVWARLGGVSKVISDYIFIFYLLANVLATTI